MFLLKIILVALDFFFKNIPTKFTALNNYLCAIRKIICSNFKFSKSSKTPTRLVESSKCVKLNSHRVTVSGNWQAGRGQVRWPVR